MTVWPVTVGGSIMACESCRGVDGLEKVSLLKYGDFGYLC